MESVCGTARDGNNCNNGSERPQLLRAPGVSPEAACGEDQLEQERHGHEERFVK